MAKPFLCRVGVAQISCNPAYADELVACLQEPLFPEENEKVGLFTISGLEEISKVRHSIAEQYIAHLWRKIEAITRFAAGESVELLVFPEYSIPAECLPACRALSDEVGIAIVAGSHVVTSSQSSRNAYRELQLRFDEGPSSLEEHVRQAACIALIPGQAPIAFVKHVRSKWETCLVAGSQPFHTFKLSTPRGRVEVQILICIEALSQKTPKEKHDVPRLIAIPAFTPKSDPFDDEGRRALRLGKCTLLSNVSEFGGTRVFARAESASLWLTDKDGCRPVPKGSEALVVMEADLEKQFEIRQSAKEHTAVTDLRVFPILYTMDSIEAQQYADMREVIASSTPSLAEIGKQVEPFTSLKSNVFPQLLQEKLAHFTGHVAPVGAVTPGDAIKWITPIIIRDTPSTDALRWELCNQAIEAVNQLQLSGKYVHKTKELSDVYLQLISKRNQLSPSVGAPKGTAGGPKREVAPTPSTAESPFINRDAAFDRIRQFFNQPQNPAFLLGGMRGIGKSSLVQEAFRQAIPPRKAIRLQMTEGMSHQRLLAELAYACNFQVPESATLSRQTVQDDLTRRVLSYLARGPGAVVVLDDFQFLLSPSGEIDDPQVKNLVKGLMEAGLQGKTRFFIISHIQPKLSPDLENYCVRYTLRGLEPRDTERLLLKWMQFGRDDLAGQVPAPSERLVSILGGHPLATRVAARLWADHPTADIAEELSIFKELRDTIVTFILEKLTLSHPEKQLLSFASILRLPVSRQVFLNWGKEEAGYQLDSLVAQYLMDTTERGYQLHPLIRSFFHSSLGGDQLKAYHKIAAKFYEDEFERLRKATRQLVPEYLGEAVHHFLASGDLGKARNLAFYRDELKPVAREHYKRGDLHQALKEYKVLAELDRKDLDAHFHLCLIYAKMDRWADAEIHFDKAMTLNAKAFWVLQAYGSLEVRSKRVEQGVAHLLEAEQINPQHSPTLVEVARLKEMEGDAVSAEDYYRRAVDADRNNSYAYYRFARFLYREGATKEAYEMAKAALATDPTNEGNKKLVKELRDKISELTQT